MEVDLLFSCPMTFMGHAADYSHLNHGALFGLGCAGIFSTGNVLDTVCEDPFAELEDSIAQLEEGVNSYSSDDPFDPSTIDSLIASFVPSTIDSLVDGTGDFMGPCLTSSCDANPIASPLSSLDVLENALSDADVVNMMGANDVDAENVMLSSDADVAKMGGANDADVAKMIGINDTNVAETMVVNDADVIVEGKNSPTSIIFDAIKTDDSMAVVCEPVPGHALEELHESCNGLISSSLGHGPTLAAAPLFVTSEEPSCINPSNANMGLMLDTSSCHDADDLSSQQQTVSFLNVQNSNLNMQDIFIKGFSIQTPQMQTELPQVRFQRSFSSHVLGQLGKRDFLFGTEAFDGGTMLINTLGVPCLIQAVPLCTSSMPLCPQVQLSSVGEAQSSLLVGSVRKVYSTGDLQSMKGTHFVPDAASPKSASSEERTFKVGRYTQEERKSRICRYRQKRTERNFSKTIKYACRKTLADSRHRIRGRFARNDDTDDIAYQLNSFHNHEDGDGIASWQHVQTQWGH